MQAWQGPGRLEGPGHGSGGQQQGQPGMPQPPVGFSNMDHARSLPPKPFEMPDGWNTIFGVERFKVVEGLFDHRAAYSDAEHPAPDQTSTITQTAHRALNACDTETKPQLLNNVVLTGAGSLIEKLPERLGADLQTLYPNPKVRVLASGGSVERKYGAWIGGSVLGSLGTFHQMWVSRGEYEEFGRGVVEKRCK